MSFTRVKRGYPSKSQLERRYTTEYKAALERAGTDHVNVRDQVTRGWDGETPLFKKQVTGSRGRYKLLVVLTGNKKGVLKWRAVHGGEGFKSSWPIRPRNKPLLHYQIEYKPKHSRRSLTTQVGGKSGPWTHRAGVTHFGYENKELDEAANDELLPQVLKYLDEATRRGNS